MENNPFITVMILCYNYGQLLNRALEAVAAQSFRDFNLLFIDNGSIDNSKEVFENFCRIHPEVDSDYLLVYPNQGPTHGWNEGLKVARGEYVLFNDADDWMDPNCLELLAAKARETGTDRVTGQYREVSEDGTVLRERIIVSDKCCRLPTTMLQGVLFRKSVFVDNRIQFPETSNLVAYDVEIIYLFALYEKNIAKTVRITIYNYLFNTNSIIQSYLNSSEPEKEIKEWYIPLVEMTENVVSKCTDEDLRARMIYLVLRSYYSKILMLYQACNKKEASALYRRMKTVLVDHFPAYHDNKYLIPFKNGYEQPGSFAIWILSVFERLHLMELTGIVSRYLISSSSFLRKSSK